MTPKEKVINTVTCTFSTKDCKHKCFYYKTIKMKMFFFDIYRVYMICHECHELIPMDKKWKIKFN